MALILVIFALCAAILALVRAYRDHYLIAARTNELECNLYYAHRLLAQRSTLAGEIAHEIKNPITAILCSVDTLDILVGPNLDPEHRVSLGYIKEYGENLLRLVSDFLDLSRADGGQMTAKPELISPMQAARSVSGLLHSVAVRNNVEILVQGDENLCTLVDAKHLKQILFNLIHNAIKFSHRSGEVIVTIKSTPNSALALISVEDRGIGISQEDIKHAFESRSLEGNSSESSAKRSSSKNRNQGTGLGLALTKKLVELAGGSVSLTSSVNQGTIVEFSLPLGEHQVVPQEAVIPSDFDSAIDDILRRPLLGQSFLVVDSDPGVRDSISNLIQAWGGIVERVSEAEAALQALSERSFDAVMIDDPSILSGVEQQNQFCTQIDGFGTNLTLASHLTEEQMNLRRELSSTILAKPLNGRALLSSLLTSNKGN